MAGNVRGGTAIAGMGLEPGQGYAVSVCLEGENPPADWQDAELWVQFILHGNDAAPDLDFGGSGTPTDSVPTMTAPPNRPEFL